MLIQAKINAPDTLLKLYVAIDEDLKALQPQLYAKQLPRDPRGGHPLLSAAEVLTVLVWGAWRGLKDKAALYFHLQSYHRHDFPTLGAYSKFVGRVSHLLTYEKTATIVPLGGPGDGRGSRKVSALSE